MNEVETTFVNNLSRASTWIKLPLTRQRIDKTAYYGVESDSDVYFEIKNTILCGKEIDRTDNLLRGICLVNVYVPIEKRRQKYATRLIERLKGEAQKAGLDFFCVDDVISDGMKKLLEARAEFEMTEKHDGLSYVTVFSDCCTKV